MQLIDWLHGRYGVRNLFFVFFSESDWLVIAVIGCFSQFAALFVRKISRAPCPTVFEVLMRRRWQRSMCGTKPWKKTPSNLTSMSLGQETEKRHEEFLARFPWYDFHDFLVDQQYSDVEIVKSLTFLMFVLCQSLTKNKRFLWRDLES